MKKFEEIEQLLLDLSAKDILLYLDNKKLKFKAPKGAMTDKDKQQIKSKKENLIEYLTEIQVDEEYENGFPLTDIQMAYLLGRHQAFRAGNVSCHIYFELEYELLDPDQLELAIFKTIERHPMMRAAFTSEGRQIILPMPEKYELDFLTVDNHSSLQKVLMQRWQEMSHRIYKPETGFLFDFKLTQGKENSYLHFSIEFLIADWASICNIVSDIEMFYASPNIKFKPLGISFEEAIRHERAQKRSVKYFQDKAYWQERMKKLSFPPELPFKPYREEDEENVSFKRHQYHLEAEKWSRIKKYAAKRNLTPTVAILSAYADVLAKWSRNKTFSLNLTVLNRPALHEDISDIVGDFTSNLLIYSDREAPSSFADGAKQIAKSVFEALEHKSYSAVSLMRDMQKFSGEEVLMPFVFTSALGLVAEKQKPIRASMTRRAISQTPQVYIDCQAIEDGNGLTVNWDVRNGIFPDGLTEDMFEVFSDLIACLAENDDFWDETEIINIPGWQLAEREMINDTAAGFKLQPLHEGVISYGLSKDYMADKLAVVCQGIELSYRQLYNKSGQTAAQLRRMGVEKGDRVCIFMEKNADQVVGALAILSCGAAYVPIDPHSGSERIADIIQQIKPSVILTDGKNEKEILDSEIKRLDISSFVFSEDYSLLNFNRAEVELDELAYIIFTSGTTGKPKGVAMSHRQVANTNKSINEMWKLDKKAVVFGISHLNFDLSVYDIFGILSLGGTLVMPSHDNYKNPANWLDLMVRYKVNVWNSVPALMQMLLTYIEYEEKQTALPPLDLVMLSGDWTPRSLPPAIKERWSGANIVVMGGATEGAIWSIYHIWKKNLDGWSSVPYGRPLANQGYLVLDENLDDCPYWVTGQLAITGTGVAIGYYGDKELTTKKFPYHKGEKIYLTGDIGRYRPGGEIEFIGRMDRQLKLRGHRIEPGEIESAIKKELGIHQVVVSILQSEPVLGAVLVTDKEIDIDRLRTELKRDLPEYMIPSCYAVISTMPLTQNGKIDAKTILNLLEKSKGEHKKLREVGELAAIEVELLDMWRAELSFPNLEIEDDIYDCGGDSLLMAKMAGRMKKEIDNTISFEEYLTHTLNNPSVRAIAELIGRKKKDIVPS